mmetsp:Transcript_1931/g.2768  ORF Transcript_1931/g.2768 Transcript_1931/m.2768 type:complete len:145 (+) Transcript_1931:5404-5838(+)
MNEYISLSFSYMTFLIKHKIEENDSLQVGNVFDHVPYNYLFNRSTAFIDSQFVRDDHEELQIVLKNLNDLDPDYLNLLCYTRSLEKVKLGLFSEDEEGCYTYTRRDSPLHIAVQERNNRSVDIILRYLSMCRTLTSRHYRDIFP